MIWARLYHLGWLYSRGDNESDLFPQFSHSNLAIVDHIQEYLDHLRIEVRARQRLDVTQDFIDGPGLPVGPVTS